jgi:hypothetical protein
MAGLGKYAFSGAAEASMQKVNLFKEKNIE